MSAPFVTNLRSRRGTIRLAPAGEQAITLRVEMSVTSPGRRITGEEVVAAIAGVDPRDLLSALTLVREDVQGGAKFVGTVEIVGPEREGDVIDG